MKRGAEARCEEEIIPSGGGEASGLLPARCGCPHVGGRGWGSVMLMGAAQGWGGGGGGLEFRVGVPKLGGLWGTKWGGGAHMDPPPPHLTEPPSHNMCPPPPPLPPSPKCSGGDAGALRRR